MKKFLIKLSIAMTLVVIMHAIALLFFANGKIDAFYLKFTAPKQRSFILGNSRAAQGIVPTILNEELEESNFQHPVFNYSFTIFTSLYGPYYLESIKRKLSPDTKDGLFILGVDPWSVSYLDSDDVSEYTEAKTYPYNVKNSSSDPNVEYLLKNFSKGWGHMIMINTVRNANEVLHEDGWLEITAKIDSARRSKRVQERVKKYYKMYFSARKFSPTRLAYLKETIDYLKNYGTVCLVRIPIDPKMLELENNFQNDFTELMVQTASEENVPYLDYSNDGGNYITTDGNHLFTESAKEFTKRLAADIKSLPK